jgi:methylmalonyl-CoA mutase N-terminal domain/subunit
VERIRAYRLKRDQGRWKDSLRALEDGAKGDANVLGLIVEAAKAGATLGEVSDSMRGVFGLYREYSGF